MTNRAVRRRRGSRPIIAVATLIAAATVVAACGSSSVENGPVGNGAPGSTVGTAPSSGSATSATSTTKIEGATDLDRARQLLASADDLGTGWSTPQKATTTTTSGTEKKKKGLGIECPDLAATHPALAASDSVNVTGPTFNRSKPTGQLTQVVTIFATEADAEDAIAAFHEPAADKCIMSLLGRQKGSAPATVNDLKVTAWSVGDLGDGRAAFDLFADLTDKNGNETFHLGIALVRNGRVIDFVAIFAKESMGDADTSAVAGTVDKIAAAS